MKSLTTTLLSPKFSQSVYREFRYSGLSKNQFNMDKFAFLLHNVHTEFLSSVGKKEKYLSVFHLCRLAIYTAIAVISYNNSFRDREDFFMKALRKKEPLLYVLLQGLLEGGESWFRLEKMDYRRCLKQTFTYLKSIEYSITSDGKIVRYAAKKKPYTPKYNKCRLSNEK